MIYVVRYLLVALFTVYWGLLGVLIGLVDRDGRGLRWVARSWLRWCLGGCGVQVEVDGLERVLGNQPCLIMSNHQSVFDIAALVHSLPDDFVWKFVAKKELLWVPFFGWALAMADQIVIDRSNREKAVRSLEHAGERIRAGVSVIIFPEGTRSADARLARELKSGPFHLAVAAGVPIVPATVSGSHRITPKRSLRVEHGTIRLRYGPPIPTRGLTLDDRNELKKRVREAIRAGYDPSLQENLHEF